MADLKKLAEEIVGLTLLEAQELKTILKDEYGIEPAAGGAVMVAGPAAGDAGADGDGRGGQLAVHAEPPGATGVARAKVHSPAVIARPCWVTLAPLTPINEFPIE